MQRSEKGAESGRWGGEDTQRGVKDGETHLATPFSLQTPQNASFLISTDAITATQSPPHRHSVVLNPLLFLTKPLSPQPSFNLGTRFC